MPQCIAMKLIVEVFVMAAVVGLLTSRVTRTQAERRHNLGFFIDENHAYASDGMVRNKRSIHKNVTYCPRPKVGKCQCSCLHSICYKVSCKGLLTMPEKLPQKVIHLEINEGSISNVPMDYFRDYESILTLDMEDNKLSSKFYLPRKVKDLTFRSNLFNGSVLYDMLKGLSHIINLKLSFNAISDNLKPDIFKSMKNLARLRLVACQMTHLPLGVFDGLNSLAELSVKSNDLKRIHKDLFKGIKSEDGLSLGMESCNLETIEKGTFESMSFLHTLFISNNKLTVFPNLKGISENVRDLDLSFNRIVDISNIRRSGLKRIVQLDLSNNKIEAIHSEDFKDIELFTYVGFSNNHIKRIPAGIFKRSSNLAQLIFQQNRIESIEKGSFDNLINLKEVFLFNNKLTSLPDDLFVGLSLQNLFLNGNNFTNLTGRPFRGMKKTKTILYLFSNRIRHIANDLLEDLGNETTVALRCRSLIYLPHISKSELDKVICTPYNLPKISQLNRNVATSLYHTGFKCDQLHSDDWECSICHAGSYGNGKKGTECSKCSAGGFFQDEMGQQECKNCSIGTFVHPDNAPAATPLSCEACPKGTRSNERAGFRACKCLKDFYRFDRFGSCTACPKKGLKCINDYAILADGYYWMWTNQTSKSLYSDFIENLKIESDEFAKTTWKYSGALPKPHKCPHDSCLGGLNSSCKAGYQGLLCAGCAPSYFGRMSRCIRCPPKWQAGLEVAVVIAAFAIVLILLWWGDDNPTASGRTWADVILSWFKIIIGFYQVMSGLYSCLSNIEWPSSIIWMQKILQFVELNILQFAPLSCLSPYLSFNALQQFVAWIGFNTSMVGIILIVLVIRVRQHKQRKNSSAHDIELSVAHTKSSCIRNICVLLFATYPKTCSSIIQILSVNCMPLCPHDDSTHCVEYLRSDMSIHCNSPVYQLYSKVAIGFVIFYPIGFPMVITVLVWLYKPPKPSKREYRRPLINESDGELEPSVQGQERKVAFVFPPINRDSPFQSGLSVFYENYRPDCWFWELLEMGRKLLLTSGLTLIGKHSRTQIGLGAIISALFSMLYVWLKPITDHFENFLQAVALMAIFLNLGIGVMLNVSDDQIPSAINHHNDKIGVSIIMIAINSAVIVIVIVKCLKSIINRLIDWCKSDDKRLSCAECCQSCLNTIRSLLPPMRLSNKDFRERGNYHLRSRLLEESTEGH